jgi:hypothetical protein
MRLIANHTHDEALKGLVAFTSANLLYNLADFRGAIRQMETVGPEFRQDPHDHLNLLRTIVISYSRIGRRLESATAQDSITALIESGSCLRTDIPAEALEGAARAQGELGNAGALDTLSKAESLLGDSRPDSVVQTRLQIHRTRAEVLLRLTPHDIHSIEREIEKGATLARNGGYAKYEAQFACLLARLDAQ